MRKWGLLLALIPLVVFASASQNLNGSTGKFTSSSESNLNYTSALSAGCWVKTTGNQGLFFSRDGQITFGSRQWYMQHNSDRFYVNIFDGNTGGGVNNKNYNCAVTGIDKWHHYFFTFTNNTLKMYLDGSDVTASCTKTFDKSMTNLQSVTDAPVIIGANEAGNFHGGLMADCRIYDRVLTTSELQTLAQGKQNTVMRNLQFWQPLMEENGTTLFHDKAINKYGNCTQAGGVAGSTDSPGLFL